MPRTKKSINTGELGGSGTTVYQGVVTDGEYNQTLSTEHGGTGLRIYERMRKSDPVVKSSLNIVKLGLLQAEWGIEVDSKDKIDLDAADFVEDALFNRMEVEFTDTLKEVLTYLDFGFSVFEKVFKVEDDLIVLKKLAFRAQSSIVKFETSEKKKGITQQLSGDRLTSVDRDASQPSIPIEKLLIFSNEKEGDNWRGVSILRSAYKPWFFKENFEKIDAIGFEREAVGIPIFRMPPSPTEEDSVKADELGENLRANERAYLKLPAGWEFEIAYPTGSNRRNADESIRRFNRDIFSNVLAQFLDLGSGSTGSRALSSDQSSSFYKSLQAIADYVCAIFNAHAIPQLVDLNFDGVKKYPKLTATNIQKIDIEVFSAAIQRFAVSGVVIPDEDLEDHIRKTFGLPAKMVIEDTDDTGDSNKKKINGKKTDNDLDKEEKDQEAEDKADLKKLASDRSKKKVKKFNSFQPWRERTFAEDKVNFRSLFRQIESLETEIKTELQRILGPDVQGILDDARVALQMKDANRVQDLQIQFREEVRQYLISKLTDAFEIGKISAANEVDVAAPRTRKQMIDLITTQADITARKITDDLLNKAKLTVSSQIQQQTPTDQAIKDLQLLIEDQYLSSIILTSSVVTMGGINMGRDSVFDTNPEKIYALQRSEILDDRVCNYCVSIDARVVQKGDEMTKHNQFHFQCRGIWVSILVDEQEKPDITGIPGSLRERVGTLEEFKQIKSPVPLKDSLAEKFIKGQ